MSKNYKSWLNPETFIISDTHFGHKNIIKYENRPENHNELMVRRWNNTVSKHSRVLHLGDVFLCPLEEAEQWLSQLNGEKWLVLGNHDTRASEVYEKMGFHVVGENIFKEIGGYKIIFSHYPLYDLPKSILNIHGHIHGGKGRPQFFRNQNINVSTEVLDYTPTKLHKILEDFRYLQNQPVGI